MSELATRLGVGSSTASGRSTAWSSSACSSAVTRTRPTAARSSSATTPAADRAPRALPRAQPAPDARAARRGSTPTTRRRRPLDRDPGRRRRPTTVDLATDPHRRENSLVSRLSASPSASGASRSCSRPPVRRRHLGLGQPQAGAPAGHRVPGHHRHRAVPGRRLEDVAEQVAEPIERADRRRPRLDHPVDLGQLDRPRWSSSPSSSSAPTCKTTAAIEDRSPTPACPRGRADRPGPQHQRRRRSSSSIARPVGDGLEEARDRPARDRARDRRHRGVGDADLTGGLETRLAITLDPDEPGRGRRLRPADRRRAEANNLTSRPASCRPTGRDPGLDDRRAHDRRPGRRASSSAAPARPPRRPPRRSTLGATPRRRSSSSSRDDRLRPDQRQPVADADRHPRRRTPTPSRSPTRSRPSSTRSPPPRDDVMSITTVSDLSDFIKESRDGLLREGGLGASSRSSRSSCSCSACARRSSPRSASRCRS